MAVGLTAPVVLAALGVGLLAGALIGSIGIGGVVIVPLLLELPGMTVEEAVATAMLSYVPAGMTGTYMYSRHAKIDWRSTRVMCAAAAPAAFLGAFALRELDAEVVKYTLYALMLVTSLFSLVQTVREERRTRAAAAAAAAAAAEDGVTEPDVELVEHGGQDKADAAEEVAAAGGAAVALELAVGTVTGFGSALTGTSGPVILLPILVILGWPIRVSLGNAQAIQIPIALAATLGNVLLSPGTVNVPMAAVLAAAICPAAVGGAMAARRVPAAALKRFVAVLLVACSLALVARQAASSS